MHTHTLTLKEVGVGSPQIHVDQAAELLTASTSGIILMDLGAYGWSLLRTLTQKMVLTCPSGWG